MKKKNNLLFRTITVLMFLLTAVGAVAYKESIFTFPNPHDVDIQEENPVEDTQGKITSGEDILPTADTEVMEVHFLNVGQADSTLIICGEHAMLIDCADNAKGTAIQNYLKKQGITNLDYLILTHPDSDHIGGAPVVISKFSIDTVFMSNFEKDNKTYQKLIQALDDKNYTYSTPTVGSTYSLGSATITFLAPNKTYSDPNNSSIALLITNGENVFLFTGDAEEEAEEDMLSNMYEVDANVLQAGHHGSSSASSQTFLDTVTPEYVVISCGEGNSYGHPHSEVLNRYRAMGIQVFRTDEQGTIVAISDGIHITWNCSPSETWQSGERTESSQEKN